MKTSAAKLFRDTLTKGELIELFNSAIKDSASTGRDGTRVETFSEQLDAEIDIILRKVKAKTYKFTPYKEKLISKGAINTPRQISIPTVRDKLVLKFVSLLLTKIYPEHVSRPPHQFIKQIHQASQQCDANFDYLRLDIQNYYPTINHSILMRILRRKIRQKELLYLIEEALKTPTGKVKSVENENKGGIPQGLSISNILSSIYLQDLDDKLGSLDKILYWRFVDDILLIGPGEEIANWSTKIPAELKRTRKIILHKVGEGNGKSTIVPLSQGIDYLGYKFCRSDIEIRISSVKKMYINLMKIFTSMKYKDNKAPLIWRLNLRITGCKYNENRIGWLYFFSQTKNMQQIKQLDAFIKRQISLIPSGVQPDQVKTLIKTIHEIKFNHRSTTYIPDFDDFNEEQMRAQIKVLLPYKKATDLDALEYKDLKKLFNKCITREVSNMEKDMLEAFS